jgi:hypothetical protein
MYCFYTSAFLTSCFHFVCNGWQNRATCLHQVLLGKSTTETLEMLCEAFGEHSLSWTEVFEWHSLQRPVKCQLNMMKVQGDQAPAKQQ